MKKKKLDLEKKLFLDKQFISSLNDLEKVTGGTIFAQTGVGSACPQCVDATQNCTDTAMGMSMCQTNCTAVNCQTRAGQLGCLAKL